MFCSNCGTRLGSGVNFCPNCGTRVTALQPGNMVMLVSLGTSNRNTAAALLTRICGYTDDDALLIADSAPITVARGLTEAQARYLAQALAEYGIEVSVYDGTGWREWESANTSRQVCRSPSWATRLAAISAIFDQWVRLTFLLCHFGFC